jgi:hypothetical protein
VRPVRSNILNEENRWQNNLETGKSETLLDGDGFGCFGYVAFRFDGIDLACG